MTKKLQVVLSDEVEAKLRDTIYKAKGMKKGNISEALEEAINLWIARQEKKEVKKSANE